jgi:parallel beta-helix repeat protein
MKSKVSLIAILLGIAMLFLAGRDVMVAYGTDVNPVDGVVKGAWTIGSSPFFVKKDVFVPPGESLTIEQGVAVYFEASFGLTIQGKLLAIGTSGNRITLAWSGGGTQRGKWKGMALFSTVQASTISYCIVSNAVAAINLTGSSNNVVRFNTIRYNSGGILVDAAEGNVIQNNEIYENSNYGIRVQGRSQRTDISRNSIYRTTSGNGVDFRPNLNINNYVKDNTIYDNDFSGIRVSGCQTLEISGNLLYNNWVVASNSTGGNILLAYEHCYYEYSNKEVTIYNNRIHSARQNGTGIYIQNATQVVITFNDVYLNDGAGIVAAAASVPALLINAKTTLCRVYRNNIRNNRFAEAQDLGTGNTWDDGSKGNYWGNYSGVDANNDGIGDQPFVLPRWSRGAKDSYPLMGPLLLIVTTTTGTTTTGTSTSYSLTVTTITVSAWTTVATTIPVTSTSAIATSRITSTSTDVISSAFTLFLTTFFGTSTSYVYTVTVTTAATTTSYASTAIAVSYTTTGITATATSTSVSTTTSSTTTTTTVVVSRTTTLGRCLIASAAYDSDLAPHVQFLRDFRDQKVMDSFAGSQFMSVFNAFYYSFSPAVAQAISTSENARAVTRGLLAPLLGSLYVGQVALDLFPIQSDFGIVVAGLISSGLIGVLYASPLVALNAAGAKDKKKKGGWSLKPLGLVWVGSLLAVGASIIDHYYLHLGAGGITDFVTMVSTGVLVLSTMILSPLLLLRLIHRLWR